MRAPTTCAYNMEISERVADDHEVVLGPHNFVHAVTNQQIIDDDNNHANGLIASEHKFEESLFAKLLGVSNTFKSSSGGITFHKTRYL